MLFICFSSDFTSADHLGNPNQALAGLETGSALGKYPVACTGTQRKTPGGDSQSVWMAQQSGNDNHQGCGLSPQPEVSLTLDWS